MLSNFICKPAEIQVMLQKLQRAPGTRDVYIEPETGDKWMLTNHSSGMLGNISVLKELPPPSVDELINALFTFNSLYGVCGAACELRVREQAGEADFRMQLMRKLEFINTADLSDPERARLKIIISDTQLYNPANQRDIMGKHHSEIVNDAAVYRKIADKAKAILANIG
jgi:hypothetical protein